MQFCWWCKLITLVILVNYEWKFFSVDLLCCCCLPVFDWPICFNNFFVQAAPCFDLGFALFWLVAFYLSLDEKKLKSVMWFNVIPFFQSSVLLFHLELVMSGDKKVPSNANVDHTSCIISSYNGKNGQSIKLLTNVMFDILRFILRILAFGWEKN